MKYLIIPLLILNVWLQEPPYKLRPEEETIKQICNELPEGNIYTNHSLVRYFSGIKTLLIQKEMYGTVIYESHYGYRPEYSANIKFTDIKNVKWYKQFLSSDKRFQAIIGIGN